MDDILPQSIKNNPTYLLGKEDIHNWLRKITVDAEEKE